MRVIGILLIVGALLWPMTEIVRAHERKPPIKFICIDASSSPAVIWEDDEECPDGC